MRLLLRHFIRIRIDHILYIGHMKGRIYRRKPIRTLIITTRVDWKRDGLDFGSNTDELDWKDRKWPPIL